VADEYRQRFAPSVGSAFVLIGYFYFYPAIRQAAAMRTMAGLLARECNAAGRYFRDVRSVFNT